MAKRKTSKKTSSSRKKTTSKGRALPQGYTRAAYSSKLALDALIKKGYIVKTSTLKDMIAYPQGGKGSKTGAVNELIEMYSIEYPTLFGRGSAHQALAEHYSKSKSGAGLSKLFDKLIQEGKIVPQEGVYKQQDNPLLRSLKSLKPQMQIGSQTIADNALMRPPFNNILADNATTFNRFAKPLLEKDDKGNIVWTSVDQLIAADSEGLFGPARLSLTRLWQVVKGEVVALNSAYQFQSNDSASITDNQKVQLEKLQNNIGALVGMLGGQDISAVATGVVNRQKVGDTDTFRQVAETVNLTELANAPISTVGQVKSMLKKAMIFASSKGDFITIWKNVSDGLAKKQSDYNRDLFQRVLSNIDIVPQETIVSLLRGIAESIGKARAEGTIDSRDYAKYERRFNELIRGAKSIPTLAKLVELAGSSNDPRVQNTIATKKYAYDILVKKIQKFQTDVGNVSQLKTLIDKLKAAGTTKKQFVEKLQTALDRANDMSKLTKEQKDAILNGTAGALTTKEKYQLAVKAVQKLRVALSRVRAARTEQQARTEVAYLTLGSVTFSAADFQTGIETAFTLGDAAVAKDFTSAVKEQKASLTNCQDASYQDKQRMAMFLVDPLFVRNLPPFSTLTGKNQKEMSDIIPFIQSVQQQVGMNLVSPCKLSVPESNDPREVLAKLPSGIRAMGSDQIKARANAASRMLAELAGEYKHIIGLAKSLYTGGTFDPNAQNVFNANIEEIKKNFSAVNYDKSLRLNSNVGLKGLHYCSLTEGGPFQPLKTAPKAILQYGDLVWFPVFRGDTLYPEGATQRTESFTVGTQTFQRQNADKILTRRFGVNNLGRNFTYNWNPVDAEMLRVRYFVSLYPFSLNNKKFNQLYREELSLIKTGTKVGAQQTIGRQQAGNFIIGLFT